VDGGASNASELDSVLVVGAGLLGTSIGLALASVGVGVHLVDSEPKHLHAAVERGAGRVWNGADRVDLAVVAVPPRITAELLERLQRLDIARTYTHVASVQAHVQAEVEARRLDLSCVVGGHPMAGAALSGPAAASADLFTGRPWCVCPLSESTAEAVADVWALALAVGGAPVSLSAAEHDRAVALVSHLPQIVASGLAGLLTDPVALTLAGPGLVDTTRIAGSDPDLWTDVLTANAVLIEPLVGRLIAALQELRSALADPPSPARDAAIHGYLSLGRAGRGLVPVKRGSGSAAFEVVQVRLDDRPGELARLLSQASDLRVNVEDVRVDHLEGRPHGVVSLSLTPGQARHLAASLAATGWTVER